MTNLSPHFTLEELTQTSTGLHNQPYFEKYTNLQKTAEQMEAVRTLLCHPIIVHSGYRSPMVNEAVRGVKTSAHCLGYAVDFECPEFGPPLEVAEAIAASGIKFDQLIREYGWVHISFDPQMRGEILTKRGADAPYEKGLTA